MKTDPFATNTGLILHDAKQQLHATAGEIVLLTGAVGSGKTRWLQRLAGLIDLPPTTTATMNGKNLDQQQGSVRMLFDRQPQLWLGQHVNEELYFGLKQIPDTAMLTSTLSTWGLSDIELTTETGALNRLQGLRLNLAAITLATPQLALLDCPTDALPEQDAAEICDLITNWATRSDTTVVVTSNRWHDWQMVASQHWQICSADGLPQRGDKQT